jgi:hypothetical protein
VFQIKKFDPSSLELYSNDEKLAFDCVTHDAELVVTTRLKLPTVLQISSKGKNLTLTEFWLGNVRASSTMLRQICSVTYANNKTLSDTALLLPGTMRIEIYSKSFIEYHLLNKNFCIYE